MQCLITAGHRHVRIRLSLIERHFYALLCDVEIPFYGGWEMNYVFSFSCRPRRSVTDVKMNGL